MTALTKVRVPLTHLMPDLGPGWTTFDTRDGTDDQAIIEEQAVHDTYHLRGISLAPCPKHPGVIDGQIEPQIVLDLGANIGAFTMTCVRMGADVIAVEPNVENYELLCRNVDRHVRALNLAVGATNGYTHLDGSAGTGHTVELEQPEGVVVVRETQQVTLASLIEPHAHIAILKVDTEGSEHDILTACPHELLARCDRIVAELHGPPGSPWADPTDWGRIVQHLLETHNVQCFGRPSEGGGHLFANRYDR